jgi:hypothetical protein
MIEKVRYQITEGRRHANQITALKAGFGWKAFVTNAPPPRLSLAEAVLYYRHEYRMERIFNRQADGSAQCGTPPESILQGDAHDPERWGGQNLSFVIVRWRSANPRDYVVSADFPLY